MDPDAHGLADHALVACSPACPPSRPGLLSRLARGSIGEGDWEAWRSTRHRDRGSPIFTSGGQLVEPLGISQHTPSAKRNPKLSFLFNLQFLNTSA